MGIDYRDVDLEILGDSRCSSAFLSISEARALGGVAKLFVAWAGDCRAVVLRGRPGALEEVGPWKQRKTQEIGVE